MKKMLALLLLITLAVGTHIYAGRNSIKIFFSFHRKKPKTNPTNLANGIQQNNDQNRFSEEIRDGIQRKFDLELESSETKGTECLQKLRNENGAFGQSLFMNNDW